MEFTLRLLYFKINAMAFKLLTSVEGAFLDLFFPIKCVVCKKETGGKRKNKLICTDCLKKLFPSLNFYCPLCEARTADAKLCFSCNLIINNAKNKFYLDRLFYPFSYKDLPIQKVIKSFKYQFIKDLEIPVGRLMAGYLEKVKKQIDLDNLILMPTPLHQKKFNQRGYNQSELIAEQIISCFKKSEVLKNILIKEKATKDQVDLESNERIKNINGAFKCLEPDKIFDKKILLIDDVYTTGATMQECARILKETGAKEIIGLAIAKG